MPTRWTLTSKRAAARNSATDLKASRDALQFFNILNFENGLGWISLSAYWQSVIRGAFLLLVVAIQARLSMRTEEAA